VDEQLHVSVVGTAPGDELLAAELEVLRRHDGERLTTSYLGIPHVGWTHVLDRHLQLGRVRREKRFLRQATYPVTEPAAHEALVAEVRAGVQGDQELDRRLTVLVALAGPSGLIDVVAPTDRERARERMATVAEQVTLASAVEPLGEARATSPIGLPGPA
ncbi:MAG TPA: GPP34 family phosphoprotein, partial [Acidimicrobiales bacterium]|nr:GPP34 family phosphoprotein [Acidimicrobiales bacterium]